ncbi:dihydrofolate reductase family protein [Jeotgalibacillus proteolyticus]|uniref:dihydrofolate reductase family protein n=1 Tax=Jeotgalibacillus proteolyticus TaxID=2082395 RepID=UPI003CF3935B
MRKVVLFIAQSLDGYIATHDDSLDWLFSVEGEGDNGYAEFFSTVDTVLMGKRTYDWVMQQENGVFPYPDKKCYIFSKADNEDTEYVTFISGDISQFITNLKKEEGRDIWVVGGGNLLHSFFKEGLVDELRITVAPRVLGDGIPLFKKGDYHLDLSLSGTRTFNQFVELHYEVLK